MKNQGATGGGFVEKEGDLLVAGKIDVHEAEIFPGFPGHGPPVPPPDGPGKGELAQAGQQILLGAPEGEAVHGWGQGHGPCQAQVHQLLELRLQDGGLGGRGKGEGGDGLILPDGAGPGRKRRQVSTRSIPGVWGGSAGRRKRRSTSTW